MNNTLIKKFIESSLINYSDYERFENGKYKTIRLVHNYDTNNIGKINLEDFNKIKNHFDIHRVYDVVFINIYKKGSRVQIEKDKIIGMSKEYFDVEINIALDHNFQIINDDNLELGYMFNDGCNELIYNNKKLRFWRFKYGYSDYTCNTNKFMYRLSLTFKVKEQPTN